MPRIALALVGIVVFAACSGSQSADEEVRSFSEIAADEVVIDVDPSGTFATLMVTTSINAVCAVSYGPDQGLGSIATDQDMGGQGHSTHHAVMTGLEPGNEYQYRLQGIGPDGTLYRSELLAFSTPLAVENPSLGPNLALGATIIEVSSEFSDGFAAENAVDGDSSTEWATRGDGGEAFIVLDLGDVFNVLGVSFRTRSMSDGTAITNTFTVTVDNQETLGPFPASPDLSVADVAFAGRIIRIAVDDSTGGNTGAVEIGIYQAP
jgi:hypothetical protein